MLSSINGEWPPQEVQPKIYWLGGRRAGSSLPRTVAWSWRSSKQKEGQRLLSLTNGAGARSRKRAISEPGGFEWSARASVQALGSLDPAAWLTETRGSAARTVCRRRDRDSSFIRFLALPRGAPGSCTLQRRRCPGPRPGPPADFSGGIGDLFIAPEGQRDDAPLIDLPRRQHKSVGGRGDAPGGDADRPAVNPVAGASKGDNLDGIDAVMSRQCGLARLLRAIRSCRSAEAGGGQGGRKKRLAAADAAHFRDSCRNQDEIRRFSRRGQALSKPVPRPPGVGASAAQSRGAGNMPRERSPGAAI